MRNTPSFIGDFHQQKSKPSTSRSSTSELPIEKEADLREKRKQQILQRLKHKSGHDDVLEIGPIHSQKNLVPNDEISNPNPKVIFSPRTAKRFQEANQKRIEHKKSPTLSPPDVPTIVLQEALKPSNIKAPADEGPQNHQNELPEPGIKRRSKTTYIPSFAEKSNPVRLAHGSPHLTRREKTSPKVLRKSSSNLLEDERTRGKKIPNLPSYQNSPKHERKGRLPSQKPPLITSNSLEVIDSETESSPLRRSASFHSLKDRKKAMMKSDGSSQFLAVNGNDDTAWKNRSLPSIRQQRNSSLVDYDDMSSTKSLKLQQDLLEQDFHRLEEDLDRAFSELRKYLRTS